MNQTEIGETIGVSRMAVALWESSAHKDKEKKKTKILPSRENYKKIADLVNLHPFIISCPDLGSEYLYHHLTNEKRPNSDCPLRIKNL